MEVNYMDYGAIMYACQDFTFKALPASDGQTKAVIDWKDNETPEVLWFETTYDALCYLDELIGF